MGCCQGSAPREVEQGKAAAVPVQPEGTLDSVEPADKDSGPVGDVQVSPLVAQRGTPFAKFLEANSMAVVRATYFGDCLRRGEPFQHRAKIPAEAFIDGEEVVDLWVEFGYAFLVVISYPWLSPEHPDPNCFHLPRLVRALKAFQMYHESESWEGEKRDRICELQGGVILDYCSFWQGERSEEQTRLFKEGLNLINIPYGHRDVTALKLTSTPEGDLRKYDDRGWTLFESTVIDGKAPSLRHGCGERNVLTCNDDFGPQGGADPDLLKELGTAHRNPPLTPQRFRAELQKRRERAEEKGVRLFTNNKDSPIILDRYDASFAALCRSTKLDYSHMKWGGAEARELALALPEFHALEELVLIRTFRGNEAGEAVTSLAAALARCASLRKLDLYGNSLGESAQAVATLGEALPRCALLQKLDLSSNNLGGNAQAVAATAEALPRCASLQQLHLLDNDLGESAEASLRNAWLTAGKKGGLLF